MALARRRGVGLGGSVGGSGGFGVGLGCVGAAVGGLVGGDFVGSLCLKNHIGSLMTSDMPRCHGNTRFITEVCARPSIRDKTVLAMCDGLRGNYKRGVPWFWHGIIMSRDPVAAEYTALQTINEKLKAENEQPNALPSYVKLAESEYKLGTCDPAKILIEKAVM